MSVLEKRLGTLDWLLIGVLIPTFLLGFVAGWAVTNIVFQNLFAVAVIIFAAGWFWKKNFR